MSRPDKTIELVWRQRSAWASASRAGKKAQERTRRLVLTLGVVAAFAVAFEQLMAIWATPYEEEISTVLRVLAAVLLALASYYSKEMLTPEKETGWARARVLAEALEREAYLALMGVGPYGGEDAGRQLEEKASALISKSQAPRAEARPTAEVPAVTDIDSYIALRVTDQITWYENKSKEHAAEQLGLEKTAFRVGMLPAVFGVLGVLPLGLHVLVPALTTLVTALLAWLQASRVSALVTSYQEASTQLGFALAAWEDGAPARGSMTSEQVREAEHALVKRCETIMALENDAWRLDWLSEDKVEGARAGIDEVLAGAEPA